MTQDDTATRCCIKLPLHKVDAADADHIPGSESQSFTAQPPSPAQPTTPFPGWTRQERPALEDEPEEFWKPLHVQEGEQAEKFSSRETLRPLSGDTAERARKELAAFLNKEGMLGEFSTGVQESKANPSTQLNTDMEIPQIRGSHPHVHGAPPPSDVSALTCDSESGTHASEDNDGAQVAHSPRAGAGLMCVLVQGDPSQRKLYKAILPDILGDQGTIIVLGAIEMEIMTLLQCPQHLTQMMPPPDLIILDFLLDYSSQGRAPQCAPYGAQLRVLSLLYPVTCLDMGSGDAGGELFPGTSLAAVLRGAGFQGIIGLCAPSLGAIQGESPEQLSLFDRFGETGSPGSLVGFVRDLVTLAEETRNRGQRRVRAPGT